jgi:hypothetical protein
MSKQPFAGTNIWVVADLAKDTQTQAVSECIGEYGRAHQYRIASYVVISPEKALPTSVLHEIIRRHENG